MRIFLSLRKQWLLRNDQVVEFDVEHLNWILARNRLSPIEYLLLHLSIGLLLVVEAVLHNLLSGDEQRLDDSIFHHLEAWNVEANFVDIQSKVARCILWLLLVFWSLVDLEVQLSFAFSEGLLSLQLVELTKRSLSNVYLRLHILLDLLEDGLVLIISIEVKCSHNIFQEGGLDDLVALAASKAEGIIEKDLELLLLLSLHLLERVQVPLGHVGFCDIGGLIACHQVEVEHKHEVFVVLADFLRVTFRYCFHILILLAARRLCSVFEGFGPLRSYKRNSM